MRHCKPTTHKSITHFNHWFGPELLILASTALFVVVYALALDSNIKTQHDSGIYIGLGQAMGSGQGYRDIFVSGHPINTKYPPIFPLLLAPFIAYFKYNFLALKIVIFIFSIVSLFLTYFLFKNIGDKWTGAVIFAFTATSSGIVFYAESILTEIPYLCFSLLALLYIHKIYGEGGQPRWYSLALILVLIPVTYLTRPVGFALIAAISIYLLLDVSGTPWHRARRAIAIGVVVSVPALIWILWTNHQENINPHLKPYLSLVSPSSTEVLIPKFERIGTNLTRYGSHLGRIPWPGATIWPNDPPFICHVITILVAVGFLRCALGRRTIVEYYVVFYILIIAILWGSRPQRYLVPLIPMIWYYLWMSLCIWPSKNFRFNWMHPSSWQLAPMLSITLLAAALFGSTFTMVVGNIVHRGEGGYYNVVGESLYTEIAPWVNSQTSPNSVFMWSKPALRYLATGRESVRMPWKSGKAWEYLIKGNVEYVVVDSFSNRSQQTILPILRKYPNYFVLAYENNASKVYRFSSPKSINISRNSDVY